jgi:8-oxo-dGTP diphosphatase
MNMRRAFSVAVFVRGASGGPHAEHVFLIHHRRLQTWLPIGGEVEVGETPLEAARRELREETGWEGDFQALSLVEGTPPGLMHYEEHDAGSKGLHMNFCFVATVPDVPVRLNDEATAHAWVDVQLRDVADGSLKRAPANVLQLVQQALATPTHLLEHIAATWIQRFNDRDLDGLLALYSDDAVHISPKLRERQPQTGGQVAGKAALRAWWQDSFDRLPSLRYHALQITAQGNQVFLEYSRTLDGAAAMIIAELFVVQNGHIVRSHVFHG